LAEYEVLLNGAHAPILSVFFPTAEEAAAGAGLRIDFQVPLERNAFFPGKVPDPFMVPTVLRSGTALPIVGLFPGSGIFGPLGRGGWMKDSQGYLVAQHAKDGSAVTHANPARPGETITVYANDFFTVWPPPPIGVRVPETPAFEFVSTAGRPREEVGTVYDEGHLFLQEYGRLARFCATTPALTIVFRALAAGKVGVERIDFVVPDGQTAGDWPLFFNVGSPVDGTGNGCVDREAQSSSYGLLIVR